MSQSMTEQQLFALKLANKPINIRKGYVEPEFIQSLIDLGVILKVERNHYEITHAIALVSEDGQYMEKWLPSGRSLFYNFLWSLVPAHKRLAWNAKRYTKKALCLVR